MSVWIKSIFILLLLSNVAYADKYILATGNDSNLGTSVEQAWATCANFATEDVLSPDEAVYIGAGLVLDDADSTCLIASDGTASQPIKIWKYGEGSNPRLDGSVTAAEAGVTEWSLVADGPDNDGAIYQSTTALDFRPGTVIIDYLSNLDYANCDATCVSNNGVVDPDDMIRERFAVNVDGSIYIRLEDDTNPDDHIIEFSKYPTTQTFRGLFKTKDNGKGSYLDVRNIDVYGSREQCFSSSGVYNTFRGIKGTFCGSEAFYAGSVSQIASPGADYNSCYDCEFSWSSTAHWNGTSYSTSTGQAITIESDYFRADNLYSHHNWMAGFDSLAYDAYTTATNHLVTNFRLEYNSRSSLDNRDTTGFDPQLYVDGGSHVLFANGIIIGNAGLEGYPTGSQNGINGITVGSEHPTTNPAHHAYFINVLSVKNSYLAAGTGNITTDVNNIHHVNFIGGTYISGNVWDVSLRDLDPTMLATNRFYNNIVKSGNAAVLMYSSKGVSSDYNVYLNNNAAGLIEDETTDVKYSLAQWQAATGHDIHSINADPLLDANYKIQAGSPAIGSGLSDVLGKYVVQSDIGSVRDTGVKDASDIGYHHDAVFDCAVGWWDQGICGERISINGSITLSGTVSIY